MLVTSHFWTKGCQFDSLVVVVTFLDHSWDPLRVLSVCLSFCNILSSPPIFQGLLLSVCYVSSSPILIYERCIFLFVTFYPHCTTNPTQLSAAGAKQDVEKTPKLYSGLTIQSRPCQPQTGFGLVPTKKIEQITIQCKVFLVISELRGPKLYSEIGDFYF